MKFKAYGLRVLASAAMSVLAASCCAADEKAPVKVLMIGNSFTDSVMRETPNLAKAAGLKLDIVQCGIGGCPLDKHWRNVEKAGFLFGVDPTTFTYSPESLPEADAKLMRECARDALAASR